MILAGACHCGNLSVTLETALPPEELPVRACQCSFCRKHAALSTSDPAGRVTLKVADEAETSRYRFTMRTADFIVCRRCGVYVGAFMTDGDRSFAVVNINVFDERARFTRPAEPMDYGGEDLEARLARRRARWTPATCG